LITAQESVGLDALFAWLERNREPCVFEDFLLCIISDYGLFKFPSDYIVFVNLEGIRKYVINPRFPEDLFTKRSKPDDRITILKPMDFKTSKEARAGFETEQRIRFP